MEQNGPEKRAHPRYTVSNLPFIKARLDRSSPEEQLLTLGAGGCGFVGFDKTWHKSETKRVISVFECKLPNNLEYKLPNKIGPIQIQGNIIYSKPMTLNGRPVYYFGVQFLPEDAHRIQPLIDALQDLTETGQVSIAST